MKITLVTPTCDRPEAFELCQKWIARQTIPYHEWIVLDDGVRPANCTMGQIHLRFEDTRGKASLANKINRLMKQREIITGDCIAIIEDDDWYSANYLEVAAQRFSDYDMIGEGRALYYNVRKLYWTLHTNMNHASFCQTLFRPTMFDDLEKVTRNLNPFIDTYIWKETSAKLRRKVYDPENRPTLVGIKGLYPGYGVGHTATLKSIDADRTKLIELVGKEDASIYGKFHR